MKTKFWKSRISHPYSLRVIIVIGDWVGNYGSWGCCQHNKNNHYDHNDCNGNANWDNVGHYGHNAPSLGFRGIVNGTINVSCSPGWVHLQYNQRWKKGQKWPIQLNSHIKTFVKFTIQKYKHCQLFFNNYIPQKVYELSSHIFLPYIFFFAWGSSILTYL